MKKSDEHTRDPSTPVPILEIACDMKMIRSALEFRLVSGRNTAPYIAIVLTITLITMVHVESTMAVAVNPASISSIDRLIAVSISSPVSRSMVFDYFTNASVN